MRRCLTTLSNRHRAVPADAAPKARQRPGVRLAGALVVVSLLHAPPAPAVRASSPIVHVVAGDLAGEAAAGLVRGPAAPLVALIMGILSHAALDRVDHQYVPDWTRWRQDPSRLAGDAPFILLQAGGVTLLVGRIAADPNRPRQASRLAGAAGALLPDAIEIPHSLARPSSWLRGEHLLPWHRPAQRPSATRQPRWLSNAVAAWALVLRLGS